MNKLKIASFAGIVIGCVIGYFVSQSLLDDYKACEQIKRENKQLRQIIFEQHQRYYESQ